MARVLDQANHNVPCPWQQWLAQGENVKLQVGFSELFPGTDAQTLQDKTEQNRTKQKASLLLNYKDRNLGE